MGLADEFRHWPDLDARAIPRRQRILFYGRPGTGKTSAAEGLASEIGVPLLVVRLDSVVSSLLGETASNLRRIFDYARRGSWVILFDEFDALAKSRDDPTEHGEIKRVVSAFLQMLDSFTGRSLLIAASNHEQLLDSAVWRRFDEIIAFGPPNQVEAKRILKMRLTPVTYPARAVDEVVRSLRGLPQAAVENVAWSAMRAAVLRGDSSVRADDLETAASNVRSRPW
jgi:SpoVK/Ycf46/Vps4 family AAA+-type ATPase